MADDAQLHTDTDTPEVAKLLITHTVALRAMRADSAGGLDVDAYLEAFAKVYKGIATVTTLAGPPEEDTQKGGQGG